jgi:malate dehydrogenase (oxaloacetate-decarboxylating)(NADP+)
MKIENAKIIVSGAGSAALACANLYVQLGVSA